MGHFDFHHALTTPFRMQPGLRKLAAGAPQLTPLRPGARHLREKQAVLAHWPTQALLQSPGFDATPALWALALQAQQEHPEAFEVSEDAWHARHLGWRVDAQGQVLQTRALWPDAGPCLQALAPAWRQAALLCLAFAEDFAILDAASQRVHWLAICLPSHWAPEQKIGLSFAELHAPVADNQFLTSASAHLVRLVTSAQRWERFVWTITSQPRLHAHPRRMDAERWPASLQGDSLVDSAWWRTERQTFIPLVERGQAVFTIHTEVTPLRQALPTPEHAALVHDSLASMSPAVLAYRELSAVHAPLLAWLAQQAQGARP
ncbi:heme-dependent oxidative N-demethylase subunit alpha family protein [Ideonella paludis]